MLNKYEAIERAKKHLKEIKTNSERACFGKNKEERTIGKFNVLSEIKNFNSLFNYLTNQFNGGNNEER